MSVMQVGTIYGVDAARDGWVVARADPDLTSVSIHLIPELEPLFWRVMRDEGLLAIDIPIGLPESGPRQCDRAARHLLGFPRGSSVFPAPMRSALHSTTFQEACELNARASGRKLSRQSFNIIRRLREVDELIWIERQKRIFEVHPEVSFMTLGEGERGVASRKKSAEGKRERLEILQPWFPGIDLEDVLDLAPPRLAPVDDQLDSLACLATASRIHARTAIRLPAHHIEFDQRSLRMEILA